MGEPHSERSATRPLVALVAPFSGARQAWGALLQEAVIDLDAVRWQFFDDQGDAGRGESCARAVLAEPEVAAVVGHFNSGGAARALPLYASADLPCLLPLATDGGLTAAAPGLVLRACPTDSAQAEALLRALNDREVCVLHDDSAYGVGLANQLTRGGARPLPQAAVQEPEPWPAAIIVSAQHRQAAQLARGLRAAGCDSQLAFVDDCGVNEFVELAGKAAEGALVATFPGGARSCVDEAVRAVHIVLSAAPDARGAALVAGIRAASRGTYDEAGERVDAVWHMRSLALRHAGADSASAGAAEAGSGRGPHQTSPAKGSEP